jgi:filamentous hemagglutinin family protein
VLPNVRIWIELFRENRTQIKMNARNLMIWGMASLGILIAAEPVTMSKSVIVTLKDPMGAIVWTRALQEGEVFVVEKFVVEEGERLVISGDRSVSEFVIRVTGNEPSVLNGTLEAEGSQVLIINPHGLVVGEHGMVVMPKRITTPFAIPLPETVPPVRTNCRDPLRGVR